MTAHADRVTLGFEAEVKQLLHLMIHSLYSNKEIFLRELVSNASDACDKLRFATLSNDALYEGDSDLKVRISFDKDQRTITITDNGIGMDRDEVKDNIGTIARSGTRQFFESLSGDQTKDAQLIGQFGVGFYSSFIVADRVTLETRKAGLPTDQGVRWESAGGGEYTLETIDKPGRGTTITLHLREGEDEFLDGWRIRSMVRKYSDHISLPIVMQKDRIDDKDADDDNGEAKIEEPIEETVNSASALWMKNRDEISDEAYTEFYKHIGHDFLEPLARLHSKVEGTNEYTMLLYIPSRAPFDLWDRESKHGVKLYVRRVFVMEDSEKLMPRYLRFVRGVIDSDSLPLNVSREILQQNKQLDTIRAGAVKKVLGLIEDLAKNEPEKFKKFWAEFGQVLKEGPIEDFKNQERVAKLLRFSSTHTDTDVPEVSLADYVERMKPGQEKIYYITADTFAAAKSSPHLEVFRKRSIEVLLLSDKVDEWLVGHLTQFDGKQLASVAKGDLDLGSMGDSDDSTTKDEVASDYKVVIEKLKAQLDTTVADVRISSRLTESPACLVSEAYAMSRTLEKLMRSAGQHVPSSKPILEINPQHALVKKLQAELDGPRFESFAQVLYGQAVLAEGGQLENPAEFVSQLNRLLQGV